VLAAPCARGQAPEPKPSDGLKEEHSIRPPQMDGGGNAAWEYYRLWDSLPKAELEALSNTGNAAYLQNDPPKLAPVQRELCQKYQDYIEGLIRVAAMPVCEWGVQHQYGEDYRLPHLGFLRYSYRTLVMDYHRCTEDGNVIGAAARLAAIIRASNQTRTDGSLFSALVMCGHLYNGFDLTNDFLKSGTATPATARTILDAYRSIQLDDLFGWMSAMEVERWTLTQWPRTACTGRWAGAVYLEKIGGWEFFGSRMPRWFLTGMNEQQLNASLDQFDRYLALILPLWKDPANDLKLRELETEAVEGQFGLVAGTRAYILEQERRSMWRARRQIVEAIGALEEYLAAQKVRSP
jgi:hypothetical protein